MALESLNQATLAAALICLLAIGLAAVVAAMAYVYRARLERHRGARRVLYLLLEVRYATAAALFHPGRAADQYIRHFIQRLEHRHLRVAEEQIPITVRTAIEAFFETLATEIRRDIRERLLVPLDAALHEMATTDPLIAHRLRGKEKVERLVGPARKPGDVPVMQHTASVRHDIKETSARIALDWLSLETTEHTLGEIDRLVSEDILTVATACGSAELARARGELGSVPEKRYRFDEINEYLDSILIKVIDRLQITSLASA